MPRIMFWGRPVSAVQRSKRYCAWAGELTQNRASNQTKVKPPGPFDHLWRVSNLFRAAPPVLSNTCQGLGLVAPGVTPEASLNTVRGEERRPLNMYHKLLCGTTRRWRVTPHGPRCNDLYFFHL